MMKARSVWCRARKAAAFEMRVVLEGCVILIIIAQYVIEVAAIDQGIFD